VKTDAKDAVHLARLLRLDEFTAVAVPTVEQEAARDLVRAREDARGDLMRARHRLSKLLLRQGFVYSGGAAWTDKHDVWLRHTGAQLSAPATRATFESDYDAVLSVKARRDRLDVLIEQMAAEGDFTPLLRRLGCLRGIGTLTRFALAVEVGDWDRFTGKTIGSFIGLVPSECSSGQSRSQGSITKTGNTHLRRLLVEARDALQPNSPSCDNQPAHISLTARRPRHAQPPDPPTKHETPAPNTGTGVSPCLLTEGPYISASRPV
jgi:transposase